jgi:hypothetical protein
MSFTLVTLTNTGSSSNNITLKSSQEEIEQFGSSTEVQKALTEAQLHNDPVYDVLKLFMEVTHWPKAQTAATSAG